MCVYIDIWGILWIVKCNHGKETEAKCILPYLAVYFWGLLDYVKFSVYLTSDVNKNENHTQKSRK